MSDMLNNSEVLKFTGKPEINKNNYSNLGNGVNGSLARVLEPVDNSDGLNQDIHDFLKKEDQFAKNESSKIKAEIFGIKKTFKIDKPENILPFTKTVTEGALITNYPSVEVQKAPRGIGLVGNEGREASGGDRTGGENKKGRGIRIFAGVAAGVVAVGGMAYGLFKDKIDSFFGGSVDPNSLPPGQTVGQSGEMPSQSEGIESPTPSAEVTPEVTQSPSPEPTEAPTLSPEEVLDQQLQDFLNKEGDYTKEKMGEMAIWGSRFSYEDGNGTDLGILRIFNERSSKEDMEVAVYGNLITVTKDENNNIFLTMGFDGKDGNRFETNLMALGSAYDYYHNLSDGDPEKDRLKLGFMIEEGLHLDDNNTVKSYATSSEEIYNYLIGLKGKKIVATISAKKMDLSGMDSAKKNLWEERNNRLPYTYNLIKRLADNGIDTSMIGSSGKDITLIDSSDDLNTINPETVPIIINIKYKK